MGCISEVKFIIIDWKFKGVNFYKYIACIHVHVFYHNLYNSANFPT